MNQLLKHFRVVKESKEENTFSYKKGKMYLDFKLRVDQEDDLKDFLAILRTASEDVRQEISKRYKL